MVNLKTYEQLTPEQQKAAQEKELNELLKAVVTGEIRFNDEANHDDLQARIDGALRHAEEMQTPWFAGEIIMERCGDDLRSLAEAGAEQNLYAEPGDPPVVYGIIKDS